MSRYAPAGYVISRVFARDADFSHNARLTYHLVAGEGRPPAGHLFHIDTDLGAVSVSGDLQRADRDHYDLVVAVSDDGVPAQSAVVSLTVCVVDKAWAEPHAGAGGELDDDDDANYQAPAGVADVFIRHRLILIVVAIIFVFVTFLLILAIIGVKCHQVTFTTALSCDEMSTISK